MLSKTKLIVEGKSNDEYENEIFHIVNKCIEIAQDDSIKYRDREKAIIDYIRKEQMYLVEKFKVDECAISMHLFTMWKISFSYSSLDLPSTINFVFDFSLLDTPYGEYIRSQIDNIGDEHWIKVYNGRCAFLNDENLCDMHCQIGPKHMAFTCRQYPDLHQSAIMCNKMRDILPLST